MSLALARAGAEVILLGRTVRKLEAVHAEIEKARRARKPASCRSTWSARWPPTTRPSPPPSRSVMGGSMACCTTRRLLGTLTPIEQYDVPIFMRVMHVNVTAEFVLTRQLLPLLRASHDAAVLFTSSGVGNRGRAYWGAYSISKFAVEGLAQVLAQELEGTSRVRVNIIDPGKVRTTMRRAAYPSEAPESLPTPESLTAPWLALLGPASRGVTGQRFRAQAQ